METPVLDVLLYLLFAVAAVLAVLALYASTRPDTFSYARSALINAPPDKIFPLINDPRIFNTWNPFVLKDPATKLTYQGAAQGKGAISHWDGNRNVGRGNIEVTDAVPPSKIVMQLNMIKPIAAQNHVEFTLEPKGNATSVTWAMSGGQPLLAKVMNVFIDCDKMVGGEFEKGLASLKALAER
jgi:uncharacterized protein YndB with AHSA1/START domain